MNDERLTMNQEEMNVQGRKPSLKEKQRMAQAPDNDVKS